jgi:ribosomal protein S21
VRPANAIVEVRDGQVDAALKRLKKVLMRNGVLTLMKPDSRIHAYQRPALRRKLKSLKARKLARRSALRRERYEQAYETLLGHSL